MRDLTVLARNGAGQTTGVIDTFSKVEAAGRYNDIGTWLIEDIPTSVAAGLELLAPGAGIAIVTDDDETVFSGPVTRRERVKNATTDGVRLAGKDDSVWLRRRVAHPQPAAIAPPYAVNAYDTRTAVTSTMLCQYVDVNAGPSAIATRRVPGLAIGVDPAIGRAFTAKARWYNLLEWCQFLGWAGGVGFRVRDLVFEAYAPADKSASVIFSDEQATIAEFSYFVEAPEENYEFAGGSGAGTARTVVEGQDPSSIALWGRAEGFIDRRDSNVAAEIQPDIDKALADKAARAGVEIVPIEAEGRVFLDDYRLGDRIKCIVDGTEIVDTITKVTFLFDNTGLTIKPFVGNPAVAPNAQKAFDQLRALARRTRNLEVI